MVLVGLTGTISLAGNAAPATHVLFIGNSYTYYHSLPQMFKAMAEEQFPDQQIRVEFVGGGGATLRQHWEIGQALAEIRTGDWDYVVVQGQSKLGLANLTDGKSPDQFDKYARLFAQEIHQSGAQTVFYMTWSRRNSPDQQQFLISAYGDIAVELKSKVAPVGMVWAEVRDREDIELYMPDGSHPSEAGSYLAALTLLATIFEIEPQGISGYLSGHEILRGGVLAEEESVLCDLPQPTVAEIEAAVSTVLQRIRLLD